MNNSRLNTHPSGIRDNVGDGGMNIANLVHLQHILQTRANVNFNSDIFLQLAACNVELQNVNDKQTSLTFKDTESNDFTVQRQEFNHKTTQLNTCILRLRVKCFIILLTQMLSIIELGKSIYYNRVFIIETWQVLFFRIFLALCAEIAIVSDTKSIDWQRAVIKSGSYGSAS